MKITKSVLCFLSVIFFSYNVELFSQELDPFVHRIVRGDSLESVAKFYFPRYKNKYGNDLDAYIKDFIKWNPHLDDREDIPLSTDLYLEEPYSPFVPNEYAKELSLGKGSAKGGKPGRFHAFAHVTASKGTFSEKLSASQIEVTSKQNSPVSLGAGITYAPPYSPHSIASSAYWSKLTASGISGTDQTVEVPDEIGANIYYQFNPQLQNYGFYGGIDWERFSTFNVQEFLDSPDSDLKPVENTLTWATVGYTKVIPWGATPIMIKISLSKSIGSEVEKTSAETSTTTKPFQGRRMLFYFNHRIGKRYWYHFLFKRHDLEGSSKLTITRFGLGVGMSIF